MTFFPKVSEENKKAKRISKTTLTKEKMQKKNVLEK